jgi:polyferredoxin
VTRAVAKPPKERAASADAACGPVAKSKNATRRAVVLALVHVAILVHVAHWKIEGRTLSPLEPSEAMQTLELGYVNAGFILFTASLLLTLVVGRFFCGWACHVVAYQDLCGFVMRKLGVRPRPFRSRVLGYAPLLAGLYMFAWPSLKRFVNFSAATPDGLRRLLGWPPAERWFDAYPKPSFTSHVVVEDFWRTFPGPVMAVATLLVCGPLIVWFLGNKGFCFYGCPYGGLFGVVDKLAPVRIRVTDACEGCGHCTVACTSDVLVHEEVRLYKAVVDPGCMKCLDCVATCPKDALYVGFGKPAIAVPKSERRAKRAFDLGLTEEVVLACVFAAAVFAFRALYDQVPFLMSLGLGAIAAFAARVVYRFVARRPTSLQNLALVRDGRRTRAGFVAASLLFGFLAFGGHAFYVQTERLLGESALAEHNELVDAGRDGSRAAIDALRTAAERLERAAAAGFVATPSLELAAGRSWFKLGDDPRAIRALEAPLRRGVGDPRDLLFLAMARGRSGDLVGAEKEVERYLDARPHDANARAMLEDLRRARSGR